MTEEIIQLIKCQGFARIPYDTIRQSFASANGDRIDPMDRFREYCRVHLFEIRWDNEDQFAVVMPREQ